MRNDLDTQAVEHAGFRVALVGCGRIADVHVEALRTVADATIVACCDVDETVAQLFASRHRIDAAYTDVQTMLTQCKPGVVHLLTPPASHRTLVELCAKHRAHVYVEKPLASNEADARAILETAKSARVQVCPGHSRLFDPPFLKMRRRIEAGEIGRVLSVRAEQGFSYEIMARGAKIPWSHEYEWGIYENLIPHPLYLVTHFLSNPGVPLVAAFDLGSVREAAVEEIHILIPSDAAVGEVVLSMNAAPQRARIEVVGTRGSLTTDYLGLTVTSERLSGMPSVVQRLTAGFHASWQQAGGSLALVLGGLTGRLQRYMGVRRLVPEFYRALRDGNPPPVRLEEGVLTARLMEQIHNALAGKEKPRVRPGTACPSAHALVTGATGFLGGRLIERLAQAGISTRATTRIASRARPMQRVEWVECNLKSEDDLRRAMAGVETVFHCAALAGPPGSLEEYEDTNVNGTLRVAKIAEEVGVRDLVYVSSISVYGIPPRGHRYFDEEAAYDSRADQRGFYTRSKLRADRALLEHARKHSRPRIVVLRPGTLYGPGAPLPIGRFELPSLFRGRPFVAGGPDVPMPLSFVDNVIDAMLAAERSDVPSGSVFNVVDDPEWDQRLVAATIAEVSRGRIRPRLVPYPLVWLLMLTVDLLAWARQGKLGHARYRLERTLADMRYPSIAAREALRWMPRVCLSEGIARVLAVTDQRPYPY